ncbi:MAG: S1 RNA-binding domain-containing protein [Oscillospiraceae bacterium]|nr:S1 RNA-binding domain-containing protein [Oscillospiraceae bacterium]
MQLEVGEVFEGKVTGITKFGAFVAMPDGKNGLVHISEIANTFVSDINEFVKTGETVKVKVIGIGEGGKVNLSMKQAQPPQPRQNRPRPAGGQDSREPRESREGRPQQQRRNFAPREDRRSGQVSGPTGDVSFEDKLKQFMQESDSRIADNKMYADHRSSRRRR